MTAAAGTVLVLIGAVFGVGLMIAGAVGRSYSDVAFTGDAFTGDALVQSNPFDKVYTAFCGVYGIVAILSSMLIMVIYIECNERKRAVDAFISRPQPPPMSFR